MRSPGDPATWPASERRMKAELDAAGIAEDTVWELVNAKTDYPQAVPIMVDWLEHLDERVPAGEDRRAWRAALLRNLVTANAKGNRRAVDAVVRQFDITPPLTPLELEAAVWAFAKIAQPADFDRVAALIRDSPLPRMNWVLVQWLGKVKTPEAVELAVEQLADPRTRVQAMRTLVRQKAPGVRGEVARYLDDDEPVFRKEAERALAKLPE